MILDPNVVVGDKVRSYDFPANKAPEYWPFSFVEGVIEGTVEIEGLLCYRIRATARCWQGEYVKYPPKDVYVMPPVNGLPFWQEGKGSVYKVTNQENDDGKYDGEG